MQTLTEFMGKIKEDIEILLIVSWSGTRKVVFPATNFEMKIFILKFIKNATFYPKWKIDIWTW